MGARTTAFGEALQWSMKSGVDVVYPNISIAAAADCIITKVERNSRATTNQILQR